MIREDYPVNDSLVAGTHEMDTHRNADLNPRPDRFLIENLTGTGYIGDRIAETIGGRAAGLFQDDRVAGRVLRNRAGPGSRCSSGRGLRSLSPGKRGDNC